MKLFGLNITRSAPAPVPSLRFQHFKFAMRVPVTFPGPLSLTPWLQPGVYAHARPTLINTLASAGWFLNMKFPNHRFNPLTF
jgi:hypothetical protein